MWEVYCAVSGHREPSTLYRIDRMGSANIFTSLSFCPKSNLRKPITLQIQPLDLRGRFPQVDQPE